MFKESSMKQNTLSLGASGFNLVCDSAFKKQLGLVTTRKKRDESGPEILERLVLCSVRTSAEHGNSALKAKCRRLFCKMPCNDWKRHLTIKACLKLYHFVTLSYHRNQVAKRYGLANDKYESEVDDCNDVE